MTTESEDQLTRMKTNTSLNSDESHTEEVKVHRAPVVMKSPKKSYCERHPKVCKAGRIAGDTALVGLAVAAAPEAIVEAPLEMGMEAYKKRKGKKTPKTETVKAPTKTATAKKKSPSKPKTAAKKKTTKAPVKKKPASKKSTPNKSMVKKKTKSKTATKKKSSSRKDDLSYWRI